jgi:uncharacterized membrane protein HdeD (DUF308 family)
MKKIFGWFFLVGGIASIVANVSMLSEGKSGAGESLIYGFVFLLIGILLLRSAKS